MLHALSLIGVVVNATFFVAVISMRKYRSRKFVWLPLMSLAAIVGSFAPSIRPSMQVIPSSVALLVVLIAVSLNKKAREDAGGGKLE